jgi:hypothetical protein
VAILAGSVYVAVGTLPAIRLRTLNQPPHHEDYCAYRPSHGCPPFCEKLVEFDTASEYRIVTFCEGPRAQRIDREAR